MEAHKAFRKPTSGAKVKKKKSKVERHNPKAFTFSGGHISVQRRVQRAAEITEKRLKHQAAVEKYRVGKISAFAPPIIVVVQGPPGCGKTTVIKSLIKHYSKQSVSKIGGPITVVAGKNRRLTFIESDGSVANLLDLSKIADIAILMMDARKGIENDTFEFMHMMRTHGTPRMIGVLSHLDTITKVSQARKIKKKIKSRFWKELYQGAKVFNLSGMKGKRYLARDTINLSRFISTQKVEPIVWRSQHPYLLALGLEVHAPTEEELAAGTRAVTFSGYLKGAPASRAYSFHIPGCGDFALHDVSFPEDPCPLPTLKNPKQDIRKLGDAVKHVYAPLCDVGTLALEGTSLYVKLRTNKARDSEHADADAANKADEASDASSDGSTDVWDTSSEDNDEDVLGEDSGQEGFGQEGSAEEGSELDSVHGAGPAEASMQETEEVVQGGLPADWECTFDHVWSDDEEAQPHSPVKATALEPNALEPNALGASAGSHGSLESRLEQAETNIYIPENGDSGSQGGVDWNRVVYNSSELPPEAQKHFWRFMRGNPTEDVIVDLYGNEIDDNANMFDVTRPSDAFLQAPFQNGEVELNPYLYISKPVAAYFASSDAQASEDASRGTTEAACDASSDHGSSDDGSSDDGSSESSEGEKGEAMEEREFGFGTQEGERVVAAVGMFQMREWMLRCTRALCFITGSWESGMDEEEARALCASTLEELLMRQEDWSIPVGAFMRGTIKNVPLEWLEEVQKRSGATAIVLGGVRASENTLGFIHARAIRHRWCKGVLKTTEPLLFSVGWRRFQSLPYFAIEDRNSVRFRYLKYTPEHMHCEAFFHAHAAPPGAGVLAIKYTQRLLKQWRISLTGSVLENLPAPRIMKKIKFIGDIISCKQHTAYVRMFNSDAEVHRCIGVPIQTQSRIRGLVKKAHGTSGDFRATFEAPVKPSDIVILKAWYRVPLEPFCNPMLDVASWDRLRTFNEVRRELLEPVHVNEDSVYKKKELRGPARVPRLRIPKSILTNLPFKAIPKDQLIALSNTDDQTKAKKIQWTPYEVMVNKLLNQAVKARQQATTKHHHDMQNLAAKHNAEAEKRKAAAAAKQKDERKLHHVKRGISELKQRKRMKLQD